MYRSYHNPHFLNQYALTPSPPNPGRREKALIKPFEVPQEVLKWKFNLIFILIQLSEMHGTGRVTLLPLRP